MPQTTGQRIESAVSDFILRGVQLVCRWMLLPVGYSLVINWVSSLFGDVSTPRLKALKASAAAFSALVAIILAFRIEAPRTWRQLRWHFKNTTIAVAVVLAAGLVGYAIAPHFLWVTSKDTVTSGSFCVGAAIALLFFWIHPVLPGAGRETKQHIRGTDVLSHAEADQKAQTLLPPGDQGLLWGGVRIPSARATDGFLAAGTIGSGKTVNIDILMKDALLREPTPRALLYDAKTEAIGKLRAMGVPEHRVTILNPFDSRCAEWYLALDFVEPHHIHELACMLFPIEDQKSPFFDTAAQAILEAVIHSLRARLPEEWSLRDIILVLQDPSHLQTVLRWAPDFNAGVVETYLAKEKTAQDIITTIQNKLRKYKVIAERWDQTEDIFSLTDWIAPNSRQILVMGESHTAKAALSNINRVLFHRAGQLLLDQQRVTPTWFFLDEVGMAGRLDGLAELLSKGRSKGLCAVLGFQDISALRETYGREGAESITAVLGNKLVLRLGGEETASWAEAHFGQQDRRETHGSRSTSYGPGGRTDSYGSGDQIATRPTVLASQWLAIPPMDVARGVGLRGFSIVPHLGRYEFTLPTDWVCANHKEPTAAEAALNFSPWPEGMGALRPWDAEELRDLGLSQLQPRPKEERLNYIPGTQEAHDELPASSNRSDDDTPPAALAHGRPVSAHHYTRLAQSEHGKGNFAEAYGYFLKAREVAAKDDDPIVEAEAGIHVGRMEHQAGDYEKASASLIRAGSILCNEAESGRMLGKVAAEQIPPLLSLLGDDLQLLGRSEEPQAILRHMARIAGLLNMTHEQQVGLQKLAAAEASMRGVPPVGPGLRTELPLAPGLSRSIARFLLRLESLRLEDEADSTAPQT